MKVIFNPDKEIVKLVQEGLKRTGQKEWRYKMHVQGI